MQTIHIPKVWGLRQGDNTPLHLKRGEVTDFSFPVLTMRQWEDIHSMKGWKSEKNSFYSQNVFFSYDFTLLFCFLEMQSTQKYQTLMK